MFNIHDYAALYYFSYYYLLKSEIATSGMTEWNLVVYLIYFENSVSKTSD